MLMLLRTLGGLRLQASDFHQPKPLLLLAYLALEGPKARRHLWELFWPSATNPANSLRVALRGLKQVLFEDLHLEGERVAVQLQTDAQTLLSALETGDVSNALLHYHGPFLDGVELGAVGFELEEWVYGTREFLARSVRGALVQLAEEEAAQGRAAAAAAQAERAYTLSGAPELEPEEIERLYPLLVVGGSPHAVELRRGAEEVGVTLAPSAGGRVNTFQTVSSASPPHNLPTRATPFVGRDLELVEVAGLLARDECRLLTLTGPGGVGKTRLALQAAWEGLQANAFRGGVFFVPLENVASFDLIAPGLAGALRLDPQAQTDALAAATNAIGDRVMLLVLDNFEHLLDGVALVAELLSYCVNLKVLVTSRERLNLENEWVLPVSGLPVLDAVAVEDALRQDAVQLFIQRAKRASLNFSLTHDNASHVLDICRLVGGSPLGIELAAAWSRMFPPEDIAQEIAKDLDFLTTSSPSLAARHRSVRAAFEHSWRLLGPREREALSGLSVFREGFRREAAGEVVGATIPVLASLVDKSLLRVAQGGRYDRHPLIFRYTEEKLAEVERARLQRDHAAYFLGIAEALDKRLWETRDLRELNLLEQEHGNLRAALNWSLVHDGTVALQLGGALGRFWETRGYLSEGRRWLEAALKRCAEAPVAVRARALVALGRLTQLQGEVSGAEVLFVEGLELWRLVGDVPGTAEALNRLGTTMLVKKDYARAQACFREGLELYRASDNREGVAILLNNLGELARYQDDFQGASTFYKASLALPWVESNQRRKAIVLGNLGFVTWHLGDNNRAEAYLKESLTLKFEVRDEIGISYCLAGLAGVSCEAGQFERAALLLGVVDALIGRTRHQLDPVDRGDAERTLKRTRAQLDTWVFASAQEEGRAMNLEQAVAYALGTERRATLGKNGGGIIY